jgi:hypothetical protein
MQLDEFALTETKLAGDDHQLCAACGKRLTQFLVMPLTETAGSPVRFEICTDCQAEVVETIRRYSFRAEPSKLH